MAKSARAALSKLSDIDSVFVDTTARAILRMKKDSSPDKDSLNTALKSLNCSVATMEKSKVPLTVEALEISVEGLG